MGTIPRDLGGDVARIARDVSFNQSSIESINQGGEIDSNTISAPVLTASLVLSEAPIVPNTLELTRVSDGHLYTPNVDYWQEGHGFQNLRIPAGTPLTAEYLREDLISNGHVILINGSRFPQRANLNITGDFLATDNAEDDTTEIMLPGITDPEGSSTLELDNDWTATTPAVYYKDRGRVYLQGVIADGTTTTGTTLFTLPAGYWPAYEVWLVALSDTGPVRLDVATDGTVNIGPTAPGNTWLSLDGLSFRPGLSTGRYPRVDLYPPFYPRR